MRFARSIDEAKQLALPVPIGRQIEFGDPLQVERGGLAAADDRRLNVGRQEGEPEQGKNSAPIECFAIGEVLNASDVAALDGFAPTMRSGQGIEQGMI